MTAVDRKTPPGHTVRFAVVEHLERCRLLLERQLGPTPNGPTAAHLDRALAALAAAIDELMATL